MAQQPNIELTPADRPLSTLEPSPARLGKPIRPGLITTPAEMPEGPAYGTPGPDTGWALRVIAEAEILGLTEPLEKVLAALMGARAAYYGRAPTFGDLRVALLLAGLGDIASDDLDTRRRSWMKAATHERSPGRTAVADVGDDLLLSAEELAIRLVG